MRRAEDAVMVGDSWAADVEGARAAGIRPIWFNRAAPSGARIPLSPACARSSRWRRWTQLMTAIFDADRPSDLGAELRCASA